MSKTTMSEMGKNLYGSSATQMMGGGKTKTKDKKLKAVEIVPYVEYTHNEDFKRFIDEFYLYKTITHSKSAAVYVIPPKKELDVMIKVFNDDLKKNGIKPFTPEAMKYCAQHDCIYKRCIFDLFADSTPLNYRLNKLGGLSNFGIKKRTNRLREQYWFKYINSETIEICQTEECKKGNQAKLISKSAMSDIYVFQGIIPECLTKYDGKKQVMTGGDNPTENDLEIILKAKKDFLKKYGAYKFVCSMGFYNDVSKDFSADLDHSAFSMVFDEKVSKIPSKPVKKSEMNKIYRKLVDEMKLIDSKSNYSSCQKSIRSQYKKSTGKTPLKASEKYIEMLKTYYRKAGGNVMLKADIATNMFRNGYENDYDSIYQVTDAVEDPKTSDLAMATKLDFDDNDNEFVSSKLNNIIQENLCAFPFVGLNARNYYPSICGGFEESDEEIQPEQKVEEEPVEEVDEDFDLEKFI